MDWEMFDEFVETSKQVVSNSFILAKHAYSHYSISYLHFFPEYFSP